MTTHDFLSWKIGWNMLCQVNLTWFISMVIHSRNTSRSFLQHHAIMHLGVEIKALGEDMTLRQPQLTWCVIELLHLTDVNPKSIPVVKPLLSKKIDSKQNENDFHCRSEIGSLSCLSGLTWPDMSMAVHQAQKFSSNPRRIHDNTVKCIVSV